MTATFLAFALFLLTSSTAAAAAGVPAIAVAVAGIGQAPQKAPSRAEFAKRLSQMLYGGRGSITKAWARRVLGPPDAIEQGSHLSDAKGTETWFYGTEGAEGFGSLGSIGFNRHKLDSVTGGSEAPPSASLISEKELRSALGAIYRYDKADGGPRLSSYHFNPLSLIQVVNRLHALGSKDRVLAAVYEYYRVTPFYDSKKALLILPILFEVPSRTGYFPLLPLGRVSPPPPRDLRLMPRFPLVLIEDVPLLLYQGSDLSEISIMGAVYEPAKKQIAYLRKEEGVMMRKKPLRPSDRPLEIIDKLVRSKQWLVAHTYPDAYGDVTEAYSPDGEKASRKLMMAQLVRLIGSVYPEAATAAEWQPGQPERGLIAFLREKDWQRWEKAKAYMNTIPLTWDTVKNDYIKQ